MSDTVTAPPASLDPRTARLLHGAIVPTMLRLAWPNVVVMLAQASTGLIETFWVSRLGLDALTGMALVFPGFLMMTMLSGGALGGGISSAVARALGARQRAGADALVLHALAINGALGLLTSALFLVWGRDLYAAMGGRGGSLEAAMAYSNVVFAGNILIWLMNAFASVIRGTGNMLVPAAATMAGVVVLVPLSPLLIFGWGVMPGLGIEGGGLAVVATTALMLVLCAAYVLSGRCLVRLRAARLCWAPTAEILRIGAIGTVNTLNTSITMALLMGMVGASAGPDAVAGFGTGARLEFLLIPLVFGLGAPLVAMVGTNIGAGQPARALRVALIGGAISFAVTEALGLAAAIFPIGWLHLFGSEPRMLASGAAYLRTVGPVYGFFGLGLSLYFASQGAGRLGWPLAGSLLRAVVAVGGGWIALRLTGSIGWVFVAMAVGLVVYGVVVAVAVASGVWFRRRAA